jgi:hypothetical protein
MGIALTVGKRQAGEASAAKRATCQPTVHQRLNRLCQFSPDLVGTVRYRAAADCQSVMTVLTGLADYV